MSQLTPEIDPNEPRELPHGFRDYEPIQPRGTDWRELRRKIWAPFAAIAAFIAKFGVGILKFKFLLGLFISFGAYSRRSDRASRSARLSSSPFSGRASS